MFFASTNDTAIKRNIQDGFFITATSKKKSVKALHYKKRRTLSLMLPFYVLLSARRATLQKITVLLTQAKKKKEACKLEHVKSVRLRIFI